MVEASVLAMSPNISGCTMLMSLVWYRSALLLLAVMLRDKMTSRYIASFHFITATMMAVGYGDIWAKNTAELPASVQEALCTSI